MSLYTREIVAEMARMTRARTGDPELAEFSRGLAREALLPYPEADPLRFLAALERWMLGRLPYCLDPPNVQVIVDPLWLLRTHECSDCKSHATFAATVARTVGIPADFVRLGFPWDDPADPYSHVLVQAHPAGGATLLDSTYPGDLASLVRSASRVVVDPVEGRP